MKVSVKKYANALALSLKGDRDESSCDEKIQNFLKLLQKRKKFKITKRLIPVFKDEWYRISGKVEVKVAVPYAFDDAERETLAEMFKEVLKKEVVLNVEVDDSIIGGLKIQIGEYVIDGTLAKNLAMLKMQMTDAQRSEASL